jgi:hypothetical protein
MAAPTKKLEAALDAFVIEARAKLTTGDVGRFNNVQAVWGQYLDQTFKFNGGSKASAEDQALAAAYRFYDVLSRFQWVAAQTTKYAVPQPNLDRTHPYHRNDVRTILLAVHARIADALRRQDVKELHDFEANMRYHMTIALNKYLDEQFAKVSKAQRERLEFSELRWEEYRKTICSTNTQSILGMSVIGAVQCYANETRLRLDWAAGVVTRGYQP